MNTLRRAVFKEILRLSEKHEHVIVNTHATFRWRHGLFFAMDPDQPMPYVGSSRLVSDVSSAGIDAFVGASGPGSGSELANVELRSLGGALARHTPGHGARATLDGDYLMFAVGGVFTPDEYGEVQRQAEAVSQAMTPWDAGSRYLNFEEGEGVDARVFFDADTWRVLRALRTHWDPKGLFLANHEIKES